MTFCRLLFLEKGNGTTEFYKVTGRDNGHCSEPMHNAKTGHPIKKVSMKTIHFNPMTAAEAKQISGGSEAWPLHRKIGFAIGFSLGVTIKFVKGLADKILASEITKL